MSTHPELNTLAVILFIPGPGTNLILTAEYISGLKDTIHPEFSARDETMFKFNMEFIEKFALIMSTLKSKIFTVFLVNLCIQNLTCSITR
jgi:hypothetical protein